MNVRWVEIPQGARVNSLVDEIVGAVNADAEVIKSIGHGVERLKVVTAEPLTLEQLATIQAVIDAHDPLKILPHESRAKRLREARRVIDNANLSDLRTIVADLIDQAT